MDGPWNQFQGSGATPPASTGPWSQFQPQTQQTSQPSGPWTQFGAPKSSLSNIGRGLEGAFNEAASSGLMVQPVRWALETFDLNGMNEKMRTKYPGQSEQFYKDKVHSAYNQAIDNWRQQSQQETAANPYPGHQIGNTVANVAGSVDPTWLVGPPGVSKGLSLGARVIGNAATHAITGGASNAAAQIMDIAEGQKKDFDLGQLAATTVMTGAFGAAHPVVSDFVKNLFGTRGMDTTPLADPRGTTSPMTGSSPTMNPQEQIQFKQLLRTGSVDDIKNFLATKQGPKPTWQDVNNLVQFRDQMPENFVGKDNFHEAVESAIDTTHRQILQDHIDAQTASWKNKPDIELINHTDEIQDPEARAQAKADNADNPRNIGFFGATDGKVRIFANRVNSPDLLNSVLYHESLGHYGLQQKFGDQLESTMQTLIDRNVGGMMGKVNDYIKDNPGTKPTLAAEEILAKESENGPIKQPWMDAVMAKVRQFGRQMGINMRYSDSEVRNILSMAHDAVINGKGRDVPSNMFRGASTSVDSSHPSQWLNMDANNGPKETVAEPVDSAQAIRDHFAATAEPEVSGETKFMTRNEASRPGYKLDDPDQLYHDLDRDYKPGPPRSFEETRSSALAAGVGMDTIRKTPDPEGLDKLTWRLGTANNMIVDKLKDLHAKMDSEEFTAKDRGDYLKAIAQYSYLTNRILNNSSEMGRAFRTLQAFQYTHANMKEIAERLSSADSGLSSIADDETKFMNFAQSIKDLMDAGNEKGALVKANAATKPYLEQYLNSFHFNALLSALSTHVKASIDMGTGVLRNTWEKAGAMPIGWARQLIVNAAGGKAIPGITPEEVAIHTYGLTKALMDHEVYRQMGHSLATGEGASVLNGETTRTNVMNMYGSVSNPDLGPVLSLPSHAVAAQDTFFRSANTSAEIYGLAMRQVRSSMSKAEWDKLSFDDKNALASNIVQNPSKELADKVADLTNRTLLLNSNPINRMIDKYRNYRPGMTPWDRAVTFVVTNIAPFIRVESNSLINRVIQRSPLGFFDPYTLKQLKAGGPEADLALSRIIYGTVGMGMAWSAADAGVNALKGNGNQNQKLTGDGPESATKYKEMEAGGWRPFSVHEDGQYKQANTVAMSLFPWDVHNKTATMMADLRQNFEQGANQGKVGLGLKLALAAGIKDLSSMSWINDTHPLIDAINDPHTNGLLQKSAQFLGNEAKTWVPNIINQTQRVTDQNRKDINTFDRTDILGAMGNNIKSAIPGLAQSLPDQYSVYGQPLKTGATWTGVHTWGDELTGGKMGQGNHQMEPTDPAIQELSRLSGLVKGTIVTPVQSTITVKGDKSMFKPEQLTEGTDKVKLTPAQFENYQRVAGQDVVEKVRMAMSDPSWQQMSDRDKIAMIVEIRKGSHQAAREALFGQ